MCRYIGVLLLVCSSLVIAEEEKIEEKDEFGVIDFLMVEGLLVFNSYLASEDPEAFGVILTLLSPLGASQDSSYTTKAAGVIGVATLGLYNTLELKDESYSKRDVFKRNIIAWHLIGGSLWLSHQFTESKDTSAFVMPVNNGFMLGFNHEF